MSNVRTMYARNKLGVPESIAPRMDCRWQGGLEYLSPRRDYSWLVVYLMREAA